MVLIRDRPINYLYFNNNRGGPVFTLKYNGIGDTNINTTEVAKFLNLFFKNIAPVQWSMVDGDR